MTKGGRSGAWIRIRTEEGLDAALARWDRLRWHERRGGFLTVLAWIAGVVGASWIVFTIFVIVLGLVLSYAEPQRADEGFSWFLGLFAYPIFTLMPTAFAAAVGIYVVVWMHFRRHDP